MRYLCAGSGPPLVLIHGLLGYSFSWRHNWEALARHFTVYAVDLLGIGFSDRPPVSAVGYDVRSVAKRMLSWMLVLDLTGAVVVGTSHGGGVALEMAALDKQATHGLISKVVFVAGLHPWTAGGHKRAFIFGNPVGALAFRMLAPLLGLARAAMLERMYADGKKITQETLDGYRQALLEPRSIDYALAFARNWKRDLAELRSAVELLRDVPILIIWGKQDRVLRLSGAYTLLEHLPNAKLVIMDDVGHLPYEENPVLFNKILLESLGATEQSSADHRSSA